MVSRYDFIKDLNPTKEDWRIKVKVVRSWQVPNFQRKGLGDNVEMVLLDERGGRIHATVKGTLQVRKKITDGEVYFIKNFGVGFSSGNFRPTRHEYHLSFNLRTDVRSIVQPNFPANVFDFVDYDVIEKESSDSPYLVDVIGLLSGVGEVCEHVVSGRKTKMIVGHKLECTLWEHYVDEVQTFLASNDTPHKLLYRVINRWVFIVSVLDSLSSNGVESSLKLTQLSTQSSYSYESDFLKETDRKSINDIKLCSEVTTCITYGTIKSIESRHNWWYRSCNRCPFSVCEDFEKGFSVQVRVVDNTDSASFLLFDRDCVTLLGTSAVELRELHFKRGADTEQYPEQLNVLNEKSMLFKINDEATFDNARENEILSLEPEKAADVESQTCDSADVGDISLTLLTPVMNSHVLMLRNLSIRFDAKAYTNSQ
ncbi:replication protein A 70 kDa DNA-binding subunit B-like [Gastrolobium bilobum]|uniref:replication protein A 70 kDa DNA-binding subunit B-like n=1 Tax=Gastrolobium bilobum TaxID=150636 RepID=UPI002AB25992|nr:replication protein A 70 kDa DNA-binding subunit B-like [Gastrolobium bilobum]